jgi:uncharacterized protein YbaR (Trm112 family)
MSGQESLIEEEAWVNLPADLIKYLRCPVDKGPLTFKGDNLVNERLGLTYTVSNGVPDLRVNDTKEQ